jgi:hypothetical protein
MSEAQVRASELGRVMQTVDGTQITVEYSRPRARGRDSLFGKQVHHGEVWTPGANKATTLATTKDITIDGHPVKAGRYSVWMVTGPGDWEFVLDPDTTRFHTQRPKPGDGQVRFRVRPQTRPFAEVLTWSFTDVRSTGTRLEMHWATTAVPLEIRVSPTRSISVAPVLGKRLEGHYEVHFLPPPAPPADATKDGPPPADSARGEPPPADSAHQGPPPDPTFDIRQEGDRLRLVITPPFFEGMGDMVLVRQTDEWFQMAEADAEGLKDVWEDVTLEFAFKDGRATGFEARTKGDEVFARGTRTGP